MTKQEFEDLLGVIERQSETIKRLEGAIRSLNKRLEQLEPPPLPEEIPDIGITECISTCGIVFQASVAGIVPVKRYLQGWEWVANIDYKIEFYEALKDKGTIQRPLENFNLRKVVLEIRNNYYREIQWGDDHKK